MSFCHDFLSAGRVEKAILNFQFSTFNFQFKVGSIYSLFGHPNRQNPINLSDNRCLTIGLRVQRYDYFFI